jgi:hypothetical protein
MAALAALAASIFSEYSRQDLIRLGESRFQTLSKFLPSIFRRATYGNALLGLSIPQRWGDATCTVGLPSDQIILIANANLCDEYIPVYDVAFQWLNILLGFCLGTCCEWGNQQCQNKNGFQSVHLLFSLSIIRAESALLLQQSP